MKYFGFALVLLALFLISLSACGESRGIRNNNPGNIVKTSIPWRGKVQCEDTRFECFSSAKYGIRAMTKNLITYKEKYNLNTVPEIINRWSPRHENDTEAYINFIIHRVGSITDNFYSKLPQLIFSMIRWEVGKNPYPISLIQEVVNDVSPRNSNDAVNDSVRWPDEVMGPEAEVRSTETPADYGSFYGAVFRERLYTEYTKGTLYLDTTFYSDRSSPVRICTPKNRGIFSGRWRGIRVDRVGSRVSFFYRW